MMYSFRLRNSLSEFRHPDVGVCFLPNCDIYCVCGPNLVVFRLCLYPYAVSLRLKGVVRLWMCMRQLGLNGGLEPPHSCVHVWDGVGLVVVRDV